MTTKSDTKLIVRTTLEFPLELSKRLDLAARSRGIAKAVLIRTVLTDWLIQHTLSPTFAPPPLEVSPQAYEAGKQNSKGNAALNEIFGGPVLPK